MALMKRWGGLMGHPHYAYGYSVLRDQESFSIEKDKHDAESHHTDADGPYRHDLEK